MVNKDSDVLTARERLSNEFKKYLTETSKSSKWAIDNFERMMDIISEGEGGIAPYIPRVSLNPGMVIGERWWPSVPMSETTKSGFIIDNGVAYAYPHVALPSGLEPIDKALSWEAHLDRCSLYNQKMKLTVLTNDMSFNKYMEICSGHHLTINSDETILSDTYPINTLAYSDLSTLVEEIVLMSQFANPTVISRMGGKVSSALLLNEYLVSKVARRLSLESVIKDTWEYPTVTDGNIKHNFTVT